MEERIFGIDKGIILKWRQTNNVGESGLYSFASMYGPLNMVLDLLFHIANGLLLKKASVPCTLLSLIGNGPNKQLGVVQTLVQQQFPHKGRSVTVSDAYCLSIKLCLLTFLTI
jgi:hypothetical protein